MKTLATGIQRFMQEEDGVTMVEYGLIAALISIVVLATLTLVGTNLQTVYDRICDALSGAVGGAGCA